MLDVVSWKLRQSVIPWEASKLQVISQKSKVKIESKNFLILD